MKNMLGCCGLDCEKCDAYKATLNNDNKLREKTAKLWSKLNNTQITPEMINCTGCRAKGVKTFFCSTLCQVRKCVKSKNFETCADCRDLENCQTLAQIHKNNKEALENLKINR